MKMKWKKVSDHPLPEGDGKQLYIIEWQIDKDIDYDIDYWPMHYDNVIRFCEFNPDEIESAEEKFYSKSIIESPEFIQAQRTENDSKFKTATQVIAEWNDRNRMAFQQAKLAKALVEEPSWEEKFRRETSRDILCALLHRNNELQLKSIDESSRKDAIEIAERFCAELKRGRD